MEDNDNPYEILGVSREATQQEIKVAYRKLALKHHPDKQQTEQARDEATVKFAKISNAYEILGDEVQRQNYDREASAAAARVNRPYSKMPRHNTHAQQDFFHHTQFHDPFSVFEAFFRDEFGSDFFGGGGRRNSRNSNNNSSSRVRQSMFNDPFFGGAGMGGGMFGNDIFAQAAAAHGMPRGGGSLFDDPFFGGGNRGGGGSSRAVADPFGGGGIFTAMRQMNDMMNMQQNIMMQQQQQFFQADPYGGATTGRQQQQPQTYVYSSSSTRNIMGGGGDNVINSTTTRIINGKQQTVKERIVQKADGTVERHVDLSGDDDFPAPRRQQLEVDNHRALEAAPSAQPAREETTRQPRSRRDAKSMTARFFKRKRRDSSKSEG